MHDLRVMKIGKMFTVRFQQTCLFHSNCCLNVILAVVICFYVSDYRILPNTLLRSNWGIISLNTMQSALFQLNKLCFSSLSPNKNYYSWSWIITFRRHLHIHVMNKTYWNFIGVLHHLLNFPILPQNHR